MPAVRFDASNLPAVVDRVTDLEIPQRVWANWIPAHGDRALVRALTDAERHALEARAGALRPALDGFARPADDDRVAAAISAMFGSYRSMRQQGADAIALVDSTMRALAQFPAWAIEAGCLSIQTDGYEVERDGECHRERHWPPSDAEVVVVVRRLVKARRDALENAERLLAAPVAPPEPEVVRPSKEEVEARLGRKIGGGKQVVLPLSADQDYYGPVYQDRNDGKHALRVQAELDRRRRPPSSEQVA